MADDDFVDWIALNYSVALSFFFYWGPHSTLVFKKKKKIAGLMCDSFSTCFVTDCKCNYSIAAWCESVCRLCEVESEVFNWNFLRSCLSQPHYATCDIFALCCHQLQGGIFATAPSQRRKDWLPAGLARRKHKVLSVILSWWPMLTYCAEGIVLLEMWWLKSYVFGSASRQTAISSITWCCCLTTLPLYIKKQHRRVCTGVVESQTVRLRRCW